MFLRLTVAMLCVVLASTCQLIAQKGAIFSPSGVTYGLGIGTQPNYATGFGITSTASVSILDFMRKEVDVETGFKVRDVFGGHCSLGYLMQPDSPMVGGGLAANNKGPIWYDVGFDWAGLQFLYGFREELWLSVKGQIGFGWSNAGYYETWSTGFGSSNLVAGVQAGPVSVEIGQGWEFLQHNGPNYFTVAGCYRYAEKASAYSMFGFRYAVHKQYEPSRMIDGVLVAEPIQKTFFVSVFYQHSI